MGKSPFRIYGLDTTFENDCEDRTENHVSTPTYEDEGEARILSFQTAKKNIHEKRVDVRLADLIPVLLEASRSHRAWIEDFSDDLINVPQDLYEVALAYAAMRKAA